MARFSCVKYFRFLLLALPALIAAGCGGRSGTFFTQISGIVTDLDGGIVRDARVWIGTKETRTNSSGLYVISGIAQGERLVRAEVFRGGTRFTGQNVARVFGNERTKNVNLMVVAENQQAGIFGIVRDRNGFRVQGARVFAFGGGLSSSMDVTDANGEYEIDGLAAGVSYLLTASARTYNSDTTSVVLVAGQHRSIDFVLEFETNPSIPAPQNLEATAWTTPFEPTRSPAQNQAYEALKRMLDPRRAERIATSRTTVGGNHVEVDLFWDEIPSQYYHALLGFGIYRALSQGGPASAVDFLRDPNATFFADVDDDLRPFQAYYYEVTSLNTSYPDTPNSESPPSNRYGVVPLDDLVLLPELQNPLVFRWLGGSGATQYAVYLFDEYPRIAVTSIWNTESTPTSGTSQLYTGPPLQSGRRYYYVVLGSANGGDARTLSRIVEFVAN